MIKPVIYLASPYSHPDPEVMQLRFHEISLKAAELVKEGYVVLSPITYGHTLVEHLTMPTDFEFWQSFCISLLAKCDQMAVYEMVDWEKSRGVLNEIKYAQANNIPIKYIKHEKENV